MDANRFWDEEAGVLFKWSLFWINKYLTKYDADYREEVLDEDGDYSIIKMFQWIIESEY